MLKRAGPLEREYNNVSHPSGDKARSGRRSLNSLGINLNHLRRRAASSIASHFRYGETPLPALLPRPASK